MDIYACIELHNRIVKYAVDKASTTYDPVLTTTGYFTWMKYKGIGSQIEELRYDLTKEVITFLENIDFVTTSTFDIQFLPLFSGIAWIGDLKFEADPQNIITLYTNSPSEFDDRGLVYDMDTSLCCYIPDKWEALDL